MFIVSTLLVPLFMLFHFVGPIPVDLGTHGGELSPCLSSAHCSRQNWSTANLQSDLNHHCCSTWNTSYHHCWRKRWLNPCGSKQCFVWLCRRPWVARQTRYRHDSGTIHFTSWRFWSWCEFSAARQTQNSDQWDGLELGINLFESTFNR